MKTPNNLRRLVVPLEVLRDDEVGLQLVRRIRRIVWQDRGEPEPKYFARAREVALDPASHVDTSSYGKDLIVKTYGDITFYNQRALRLGQRTLSLGWQKGREIPIEAIREDGTLLPPEQSTVSS